MNRAPHRFSLRQLQYAAAVAETLSFRKAAERCHVAQPSLSAQIAQLESALGVRLFERDRRRVLVTRAGRELLERARGLLRDADDLADAARGLGDPLAGTLRIGIIPTVSPYLLPSVAPALRRAYPRLILVWIEDKTDVIVQGLDAGTLDACLLALDAEVNGVERAVIARDPFVLATPVGHALGAPSTPVTTAEIRGTDVLLLDDGHCLRDQALVICARAKARELEFRATSLSTLAQMVAGGAGVTLLPRLAVATEARRAELRLRPFAAPEPHRTLGLIWRRRSSQAAALRQVAATLRDAYPAAESATGGVPAPRARRRRKETGK